jgi:phospholipid/cholesterol/gamma-HCH transport system substrate-binding protein
MATLKTKFSVGLFLISGIAVVVVAVIWLGLSNYLEKGRFFVAYFDESVQGLDKDSPVKYRGVSIGRVQRIGVAPDERLIEVVLKIESDIKSDDNTEDFVAQLKSVGITGLMFIEIERQGNRSVDVKPPFRFTPPYPVVPTRVSEISKIFKGMEDIFNVFRALDTDAISNQLTLALQKINQSIDDAQLTVLVGDIRSTLNGLQQVLKAERVDRLLASIAQTSDSFNSAARNADGGISDLRKSVARLDTVLDSSADDMKHVTGDLKAAAFEVKRTMEKATALLENTDQQVDSLQQQIKGTINRVDQAADSLNRFLNHVSNQPSQVIFSAPSVNKPRAPRP